MKQDELLTLLHESDLVKKTQKIKQIIDHNPLYFSLFQEILQLQKTMVRKDQYGDPSGFEKARIEYQKKLDSLVEMPVVAEYLNCTDELDDLVKELTSILNDGVNISEKE
jgi:cell fate (sporulation/competence/biofilm development) regulator YmcA (YheA/YmcA/DUF963 family)